MRWFLVLVAACGAPAPAPCPICPAASASQAPVVVPHVAIDGAWHGVLGGKLHTVVRFTRDGDKLSGVLESLDQGARLPMDSIKVDGDKLRFDISVVTGFYEGTVDGNAIKGTWTQSGHAMPLSFERGEGDYKPEVKKPLDAPFDVSFTSPLPLRADEHTHLVYELHVTNLYPEPVEVRSIDVSAAGHVLQHLEGDALAHDFGHERVHVPGNGTSTVYMWVTLDSPASPAALDHKIVVRVGADDLAIPDVHVPVLDKAAPVVSPPLHGGPWAAMNGPSNTSQHRRALIPTGGHARISQRFAIDWLKQGTDGKTFSGDPTKNASYLCYGQQALAVSDGVVTEVKDGIQENIPGQRAVPITLETIAGNHVIVDIGGGRFAFWAHFQPGSVKVKVGDHVKKGQVLGLVGNSGNSSEPHLHFHVSDGPSPLGSEGVPYAFDSFEVAGQKRQKQLPTEKEVVTFP